MRAVLIAFTALGLTGCSLVVDDSRFLTGSPDAGLDTDTGFDAGADTGFDTGLELDTGVEEDGGRPDDTGILDGGDAGPLDTGVDAGLPVVDVLPTQLLEGSGFGHGVPIIFRGMNFNPNTRVRVVGDGIALEGAPVVSRSVVAIEVSVPIDTSLRQGATKSVALQLVNGQGEPVAEPVELAVEGLDELIVEQNLSIRTADLRLYSEVVVSSSAELTLFGEGPAVLHAVGRMNIEGRIAIDSELGGPGACEGGAPRSNGECGLTGGRAGSSALAGLDGGGGGGGGAEVGGNADVTGGIDGRGGRSSPDPWVADFEDARGGGGGGGGGGSGSNGRRGGSGGGSLELKSDGVLGFEGSITATGQDGENADCGLVITLGAGGGGAGGVVLLRGRVALGGLDGTIDVSGGAGGSAPADCQAGAGSGARGRTRIDLPRRTTDVGILPMQSAADRRGPVFAPEGNVIQTGRLMAMAYGPPDTDLPVWFDRQEAGTVRPDSDGELLLESPAGVMPGLHQVCLGVPGARLDRSEGITCTFFALLP